jgi:hypothetical protein
MNANMGTPEVEQKKKEMFMASAALAFLLVVSFIGDIIMQLQIMSKVVDLIEVFTIAFDVPEEVTEEIGKGVGFSPMEILEKMFWNLLLPLSLPVVIFWAAWKRDKGMLNVVKVGAGCCGICSGLCCCLSLVLLIGFGGLFGGLQKYVTACDIEQACPSTGSGLAVTDCILSSTFYTKYSRAHSDFGQPFQEDQGCIGIFLNCSAVGDDAPEDDAPEGGEPEHVPAGSDGDRLRLYEEWPRPPSSLAGRSAGNIGLKIHRHLPSPLSHSDPVISMAASLVLPAPVRALLKITTNPSFPTQLLAAKGQAILPALRADKSIKVAARRLEPAGVGEEEYDPLDPDNPVQVWEPSHFGKLQHPLSQCKPNEGMIEAWSKMPGVLSALSPTIQGALIVQVIEDLLICLTLIFAAKAGNDLDQMGYSSVS